MSRVQRHALAWCLLIVVLHMIPRSGIERAPGGVQFTQSRWQDKAGHAVMFGVLAFLWLREPRMRAFPVFLGGVAFGALLEVAQDRSPIGRSGSVEDLLSDTVGLALGVTLALWLRQPRAVGADAVT